MVMTGLFVEKMNALVDEEIAEDVGNPDELTEETQVENAEVKEPSEAPVEIQGEETPEDEPTRDPEN
jgi:uncharacterized membrane protein